MGRVVNVIGSSVFANWDFLELSPYLLTKTVR